MLFLLLTFSAPGVKSKKNKWKNKLPWPLQQNRERPTFSFSPGPRRTSKMIQILLRWFGVEEVPLNWVCSPEQKACPSEVLVVSFLNQGHLFLSGKREMFLKARLSIKIYWLPWIPLYHTGLRSVFNCVIFSIQRFSIVKNKLLSLLFISKFIIGKAINKKVSVYKGEQLRASLGCYDLKFFLDFTVIIAKLAIVKK